MATTVDLDALLDELINQMLRGRAHFRIYFNLWNDIHADPEVVGGTGVFFGLTLEAHLQASYFYLFRLLDRTRRAQSIWALLRMMDAHPELADHLRGRLENLSETEEQLGARRNTLLAHLDPDAIMDRERLEELAAATSGDIEEMYDAIAEILDAIAQEHRRTGISREFPRWDDHRHRVRLLRLVHRRHHSAKWASRSGAIILGGMSSLRGP